MLKLFLNQYASNIRCIRFQDMTPAPLDLSLLPNIQELHCEEYSYMSLYEPSASAFRRSSNFNHLIRAGSDAEIRDASFNYWKTLQTWYTPYLSWYTLATRGALGNKSFWDLLKPPKGTGRAFDIFLHTEHGPPEPPPTAPRHKLMEVTWKFADAPFEGDGVEVTNIERNWELIRRLYDNAYGPS